MATRYYAQLLAKHQYFAECEAVLNDGVDQDWIPAFFWLADFRLRQSRSRKTYREIQPLLEYAAEQGHPWAQLLLARLMVKGKFGFGLMLRGYRLFREQVKLCVSAMDAKERDRIEQPGATPVAL